MCVFWYVMQKIINSQSDKRKNWKNYFYTPGSQIKEEKSSMRILPACINTCNFIILIFTNG